MSHIEYKVNGEVWPSATELTRLLPQPWLWAWYKSQVKKHGWRGWIKCLATSGRGMRIGTAVHERLEELVQGKDIKRVYKYDADKIADALFEAVNPRIEDYIAIEPHLSSEVLRLHGTADMIVRLSCSTGLWVGDWKTSYEKSDTHPMQLAIYALAWNEKHPDQAIDQGFIARVDKKSKKLNVKIDEYKGLRFYKPVIESLRVLWDYTNQKGPWQESADEV